MKIDIWLKMSFAQSSQSSHAGEVVSRAAVHSEWMTNPWNYRQKIPVSPAEFSETA